MSQCEMIEVTCGAWLGLSLGLTLLLTGKINMNLSSSSTASLGKVLMTNILDQNKLLLGSRSFRKKKSRGNFLDAINHGNRFC